MSTTQGVEVLDGCLVYLDPSPVPPALWSRLRSLASQAGRLEPLQAEYREIEARLGPRHRRSLTIEADRALFRRWVLDLVGEPAERDPWGAPLWPWSTGWTPEALASYLRPARGAP